MSEKKEMFTVDKWLVNGVRRKFDNQTKNKYIYKKYSSTIEQLGKINLDEKDKNSMDNILKLLSSSDDFFKNSKYMEDIETILNKYKAEKTDVTKKTWLDLDWEKQKISNDSYFDYVVWDKKTDEGTLDYTSSNISESEKDRISEILDIDFNWEYDSKTIRKRLNSLKEDIIKWNIWENFSESERNLIAEELDEIFLKLDTAEEVSLASFESYFDNLTNSIDQDENWFYIYFRDLDDNLQKKYFWTREEALKNISNLKLEAKKELESLFMFFTWFVSTWFFKTLWFSIKWFWETSKWFYWSYFKFMWDRVDSVYTSFDKIDSFSDFDDILIFLSQSIFSISLINLFIWAHSWALSSFKRRVIDDFFRSSDKTKNPYVYEDYTRWDKGIPSIGSAEYTDYIDVKQREEALDLLKSKLDSLDIWSSEYKKLNKFIKILEKKRLYRSSTFEIFFYKYVKYNNDIPWKFLNWLKNIFLRGATVPLLPIPWKKNIKWEDWKIVSDINWKPIKSWKWFYSFEFDDKPNIFRTWMNILWKEQWEELNKWIKLLYPEKNIIIDYESSESSKKVQISWWDEKGSIYDWIKYYINNNENWTEQKKQEYLEKIDRYFDWAKKEWNLKSESRIKLDLYSILEKNYIYNRDWVKIVQNRIDEIMKDKWILSPTKLKNLHIYNIWWELSILKDLKYKIETKQWVGTEEELRGIISDIKSWKYIQKYISWNAFSKLYNTTNRDDINRFINNLIENWKDIKGTKKYILDKFQDLDKFKESDFWKWLEAYISYEVDNNQEKKFREWLNKFLNDFYEWKIFFKSENEFYGKISEILWLWEVENYEEFKKSFESKKQLLDNDFQEFLKNKETNYNNIKRNAIIYEVLDFVKNSQGDDNFTSKISWNISKFETTFRNNKYTKWQWIFILEKIFEWTNIDFSDLTEIDKLLKDNDYSYFEDNFKWTVELQKIDNLFKEINQEDYPRITNILKSTNLNLFDLEYFPENMRSKLDPDLKNIENLNIKLEKIQSLLDRLELQLILENRYDNISNEKILEIKRDYIDREKLEKINLVALEDYLKSEFNISDLKSSEQLANSIKSEKILLKNNTIIKFKENYNFEIKNILQRFKNGDYRFKF